MGFFLSYVLLGLSLAAPIGPINAAQLDRGIKGGFFHAWLIGLGSTVADMFYMCLVYFGMIHLIEIAFVKAFLFLFGCFVLSYTGVESIVSSVNLETRLTRNRDSYLKTFVTGMLMALSNPLSILFWMGIYGSIVAKTATDFSLYQLIISSAAIIIGLLIWDVTMAAICSSFRKILTWRVIKTISVLSGLSLIGFGVYFGLQAIDYLL